MNDSFEMNWRVFTHFLPQLKAVAKVVGLLLLLDILISMGAALVLSDAHYYDKYTDYRLWDDVPSYAEITENYYDNQYKLMPDEAAGWVNSRNYQEEGLLWATDYLGSRRSPDAAISQQPDKALNNDNLMLLIGSSVVSGYRLDYEQSPVAIMNKKGFTAFSFGTIMYSIDQTYHFYKNTLAQYKPKVLVVGIHNDPEVISNMFVPFRLHDMSVPLLKPAYTLNGNTVTRHEAPVELKRDKQYAQMLTELEKSDSLYYRFKLSKLLSYMPFSDYLRQHLIEVEDYFFNEDKHKKAFELQKHFMQKIVTLAEKDGTKVIFVKFAAQNDQEWLSDSPLYNRDRNKLHNQLLKQTGMNIIYTSEMFAKTGRPLADFYQGYDTVHFSADACQLLAETVHDKAQALLEN